MTLYDLMGLVSIIGILVGCVSFARKDNEEEESKQRANFLAQIQNESIYCGGKIRRRQTTTVTPSSIHFNTSQK